MEVKRAGWYVYNISSRCTDHELFARVALESLAD